MEDQPTFVGIDVSKKHLDVALLPVRKSFRLPNDEAGIQKLVQRLQPLKPQLILLEATGGYEFQVAQALSRVGLPLSCFNPRQIRDFAKSLGKLAKTDTLDAWVLAEYAAKVRPPQRPWPDEQQQELKHLMNRRQQLLEMIHMENNRRQITPFKRIKKNIEALLAALKQQLQDLEQEIDDFFQQNPRWLENDQLLRTVPGVGPQTSFSLAAWLPELGHLSRQEIAALVGVAPMNWDSGAWRGQRRIKGGRPSIRRLLYMCTLVALRRNPVIKAFYDRLVSAGKAKKLAIIAGMRKLLTILNAMVKNRQPWHPQLINH